MKHLIGLLFILFVFEAGFCQVKIFEPTILSFPDISEKAIEEFEYQQQQYEKLLQQEKPYREMTEQEQTLMHRELEFELGPFSTDPAGCSWYCASGPQNIEVSSRLDSSKYANYEALNLHDFDLKTAWVEGKSDYGIGEEILMEIPVSAPLKLTHLIIYNGYCKNEKTWKANSRVKTLAVYANEKFLGNLHLNDSWLGQSFKLGSLDGGSGDLLILKMKILEVYPGEKYKDTAISEINLDGTGDH